MKLTSGKALPARRRRWGDWKDVWYGCFAAAASTASAAGAGLNKCFWMNLRSTQKTQLIFKRKIKKWLPKKWKCPGLSSWSKDEKEEVDHLGRFECYIKPSGGI